MPLKRLMSMPTERTVPDALTFEYPIDRTVEARLTELLGRAVEGDGASASELSRSFAAAGHQFPTEDIATLIELADLHDNQKLSVHELVVALSELQAARFSFANMDVKGRGYVHLRTVANSLWSAQHPAVREAARAYNSREELTALVEGYDENGDGVLQLDEFIALFVDLRHERVSAARARGEAGRARLASTIHAWASLEWLASELGLQARTQPDEPDAPAWTKFAVAGLGGASGWLFVHPLDVAKTRAQVGGASSAGLGLGGALRSLWAQGGLGALYAGLSAALTRQLTYTTMRIGLYDVFRDAAAPTLRRLSVPADSAGAFVAKLCCGLGAGCVAATLSCPVEVALVRMQADGSLPPEQRRGYRNVGHALYSLVKEEGVAAGWRGLGPTVARGMVVSMVQLGTYDQAKAVLHSALGLREGVRLHLSASLCSGLLYSATSLPLDNAKTRMQSQRARADGTMALTSTPQALLHVARTDGVLALWRGFPAYFARSGGHTVAMFLFVEQYRALFKRLYAKRAAA